MGTILIIDDDPGTCDTLASVLTEEGFLVETYTDSLRAQARVQNGVNGHAVGVMIVDLHMPGLNGRLLAEWTKETNPHIGVLYITAQRPTPIIPGHRVIAKPVSVSPEGRQVLVDLVWATLKASSFSASFGRIESKVDKIAEVQIRSQASTDEAITTMVNTLSVIGSTAAEARSKAEAAHEAANKAREEASKVTTTATLKTEWKGFSPGARLVMKGASAVISALVTVLVFSGSYLLKDIKEKLHGLLGVQDKIEKQIEPALKNVDEKLAEILRKQGESPATVPPPTSHPH